MFVFRKCFMSFVLTDRLYLYRCYHLGWFCCSFLPSLCARLLCWERWNWRQTQPQCYCRRSCCFSPLVWHLPPHLDKLTDGGSNSKAANIKDWQKKKRTLAYMSIFDIGLSPISFSKPWTLSVKLSSKMMPCKLNHNLICFDLEPLSKGLRD